jgi:hypothetical protein
MTPVQNANADRAVAPARISIANVTTDRLRYVSAWGRATIIPRKRSPTAFQSTNSGLTILSIHPPATLVFAVFRRERDSPGVTRVKCLKGLLISYAGTPINSVRNAGQSGSLLSTTSR